MIFFNHNTYQSLSPYLTINEKGVCIFLTLRTELADMTGGPWTWLAI